VVLYSDHDRIDESGRRYDHHFKPDWSPELVRCQDYIGRSVLFKRHHILELEGFSPELSFFPEWDMTLRLALAHPGDNFRHIPSVLYHQRRSDGHETEPTELEARAVASAHLENLGIPFQLRPAANGRNLIPTFAIQGSPKVSIIIPTRNALEDLQACLTSLETTSYDNYEVIVVNNASDDPLALDYLQQLTPLPRYRVIDYPYAFDYAALHNTVIAELDTDYLCLLNNDTEILTPDWLTNMLGYAQLPGVGAVGAKLLYPDNTVQHGGVIIGIGGIAAHAHLNLKADEEGYHQRAILPQNLSAVTAACLLMRNKHYHVLDGMDPELPIAFNDVDLCLRLREAGLRNVYQPLAILRHHESKSRGKDTLASHQERALGEHTHMRWRWGTDLLKDPYYNLNLALDYESGFTLGPSRAIPPWSSRVNWYTLPDCHNLGHSQPLPLFNEDTLEAHCSLPQRIDGTISLIQVTIGAPSGILDGSLNLTAKLGNQKVTSTESLKGHRGEFPFTFRLNPEQQLETIADAVLSLTLTLKAATEPLYVILYTAADGWGHRITGLRNKALRVTLALEV
jgi:GT2 family glycosyltransferase